MVKRGARVKRRTSRVRRCKNKLCGIRKNAATVKPRTSRVRHCQAAFSLPEVLVALTVLVVVVTVLTRVHVGTLRADAMARGLDAAVTELGNVAALVALGEDDAAIVAEAEADGWTARAERAGLMDGGGDWKAWSVSSTNRPAPKVSVYVRGNPAREGGGTEQRERSEDGK